MKKYYRDSRTTLLQILKEYCETTTLHGPKHIIDNNGSIIVLIFWLVICIAGIIFCAILGSMQYRVFVNEPTSTTIENTNLPIYNVRFPAVTVCNNNYIYFPATENITQQLLNKGFSNATIQNYYKNLFALINYKKLPNYYIEITEAIKDLGYNTESLMYELSQPCDKLISYCVWLGRNCIKKIQKIKTINGFCCSYNYGEFAVRYNKTSRRIESGFDSADKKQPQIISVNGAGKTVSLKLGVDVEQQYYLSTWKAYYGAEILIHDALAYPEVSVATTEAELSSEVTIIVTPTLVRSTEDVRRLPLNIRQCIFSEEQRLEATNDYSYETCVSECRVKEIIQHCSCVPFFYPYTGNVRYCNLTDIPCLNGNKYFFNSIRIPNDPESEIKHSYSVGNQTKYYTESKGLDLEICGCYPDCSEVNYNIDTQSFRFDRNLIHSLKSENRIIVKVFYRHLTVIQYRRQASMTWNQLLAAFGGIFGLCVGGSVISIIEIFYFIVLFLCKNYQPTQKTKKLHRKLTKNINNCTLKQFKIQPVTINNSKDVCDLNLKKLKSVDSHKYLATAKKY